MNVKREFVLREIAGDLLLVPTGKTALDLNGMMTLNEVGADIWRMLPEVKDEEEIVQRLLQDYEATAEEIRPDVTAFLDKLRELNIL
ncbi:MAG: PqqD family protein [Oscillospiraceae bacterium]|nr:PqqD family protein [Oscillospiraceae bacterium]